MMFMKDSERSAELALENSMDTGLHLNFTSEFTGSVPSMKLKEAHQKIASFLLRNKYALLLYNPLLKNAFAYVYKSQHDEFIRLYNRIPNHIDGHHHMHLCTNMILDHIIPDNYRVRRNFSFNRGEKSVLNRLYRQVVDRILSKHYICTDFFFSIEPISDLSHLKRILNLSDAYLVELMVHPGLTQEYDFLMSEDYYQMISRRSGS
jgi:chitin disaccharide deacetylase